MLRGLLGGFARGRRQTSAATLVLDFLAGLNDSRITYSGGANGTRVNSSGNIVAATTPRFDYDPVTLAAKGLLVEEARTNLLTYSQEFDNAAWIKATANATVTANATTSPDGTANADAVNSLTAGANNGITNAVLVANDSATYSASIYVKKNTSSRLRFDFRLTGGTGLTYAYILNLDTGVIATAGGNTATSFSATPVGNGWYRVVITGPNNSTGNVAAALWIYGSVDAGGSISIGSTYTWGAQLEAGSFPTSYIPTTSAAVTKTADVGSLTGANFTAFYNQAGGTAVAQFDVLTTAAGTRPIISFDDNTANERIELYASGTDLRMRVIDGGATQVDMSIGTIAANTTYKAAIAWAANDFAGCVNGGTVATDTSGTLPTPDRMRLGSNQAGNYQNGHLRSITYYPTARPNSLQALTA